MIIVSIAPPKVMALVRQLIHHAAIGSLTLSAIGASSSTSVRSAISSTASQASPTGGATGDGNGASSVTVQMTGAFVAVGVAAALAVL